MLAAMAVVAAPAVRAAPAAPVFHDADGIHVVSTRQVDTRQYSLSVLSAALGRPVSVRVLLPSGYAAASSARYPVLYLFHGTSGGASDWVDKGGAEQSTAGLPLIVVMPDAGFDFDGGGWFTNWYDTRTSLGPSQWETFHIDQLIPWVDANLHTIPTRDGRAVAGLSQGGFGSTTYAAQFPDRFMSVGSFSGAPDIAYNPVVSAGAAVVVEGTALGLDGVEPNAMFGPKVIDEINWEGHNPTTLATNLRWTSIWLWSGDGLPGPYDNGTPNAEAMGIEGIVHASTLSFVQRLDALGIPVHFDDYVYGTHSWGYWARDLRQYLPVLMHLFAHPPAAPTQISYESIAASWSQWGWSVAMQRNPAQQFSGLVDAGASGFVVDGTGAASVTTPPFYRPGQPATVTVTGPMGRRVARVDADTGGRLHVAVPLGAGSPLAGLLGAESGLGSLAGTGSLAGLGSARVTISMGG
jgi:S-formylglutathione hydrolase FrmB